VPGFWETFPFGIPGFWTGSSALSFKTLEEVLQKGGISREPPSNYPTMTILVFFAHNKRPSKEFNPG
jgi:hypothetical protein